MADNYADFDLATGNNDGTDWTNAWKTPADVIAGTNGAPPAAGEIIYCRGTATLGATVTNTLAGTAAGGFIKWIGVNASGVNDGTRTIIDANAGAFPAWTQNGAYNVFENFEFINSSNDDGLHGAAVTFLTFINCSFHGNGAYGLDLSLTGRAYLIRCAIYSNANGVRGSQSSITFFSSIHDNTTDGIEYGQYYQTYIGCAIYDNGQYGHDRAYNSNYINCVFDANASKGIYCLTNGYDVIALGCRFTNHSGAGDIGLDFNSCTGYYGWCAFDGNKDHIANTSKAYLITHNGTATNSELNEDGAGGGDTNQGYVSLTEGSEDFSTNYVSGTDPHLRRSAITIPTS